MKKIYLPLLKEQKQRGVYFSSTLSPYKIEALDTNMAAFYMTYRQVLSITYDVHPHDLILLPKMNSILQLWRPVNDPT